MRVPMKPRRAFTLIEMLVVILIILLLAALTLAFMPGMAMRQQSERAGTILRTSLSQARQNARRDNRAAGLRIQVTPSSTFTGSFCLTPQFVQKPDDLGGSGTLQVPNAPPAPTASARNGSKNGHVTLTSVDASNGAIAVGDSIEVGGSGEVHVITKVSNASGTGASLTVGSSFLNLTSGQTMKTQQFRVMRAPRLMVGEQPITLPADVGIALQTPSSPMLSAVFVNGTPQALAMGGTNDFVFSPSGQLTYIFTMAGQPPTIIPGVDMVCLWVCDAVTASTSFGPTQGAPVLVVIYGKSGFVTQVPVAAGANPYQYAQTAMASGM